MMQIKDQIDDLCLPYTIDLSQYNQLTNVDMIAHIDRVGMVIYDKSAQAVEATTVNPTEENSTKIKA